MTCSHGAKYFIFTSRAAGPASPRKTARSGARNRPPCSPGRPVSGGDAARLRNGLGCNHLRRRPARAAWRKFSLQNGGARGQPHGGGPPAWCRHKGHGRRHLATEPAAGPTAPRADGGSHHKQGRRAGGVKNRTEWRGQDDKQTHLHPEKTIFHPKTSVFQYFCVVRKRKQIT